MKILIIGASGLLGKKLFSLLSKRHEVSGTYSTKSMGDLKYIDITKKDYVEDFIFLWKPEIVIHTAALVNSDECEKNKDKAKTINIEGTRNVVEACRKIGCKLVYISSDYVFDGDNGPYKETDQTNPVNYYGETKLEGEKIIQENLSEYIIVRPGILYGYNDPKSHKDFVAHVIKNLKDEEKLEVDNQFMKYPTLIDDLSYAIEKLIDIDAQGIYHAAPQKGVTRYEWALKIADIFGFQKEKIIPTKEENVAKKPNDVLLDNSKITRLNITFNDVDKGLRIVKNQMGCMFNMIYSLRPDKLILNQNTSLFRINVGKEIAKGDDAEADAIIPVPESGIYPATGYAAQSKIPLYFGLIRDYESGRTLFNRKLDDRNKELKKKLIVVPEIIKDKSVILIDEGILSGSTIGVVIEKLEEAGVKEIHVRIPAPPMCSICNNEVLDCSKERLIATKFDEGKDYKERQKNIEKGMAEYLKVASVKFLDLDSFIDVAKRNSNLCYECFK